MRFTRPVRQALWIIALAVLAVTLFVGAQGQSAPPTDQQRVERLAKRFACPECEGQSVAQSNAPAAQNVRTAIADLVDHGRTDDQISAFIVDRFGERVLLTPRRDGVVGLVWVVPVAVGAVALGGLVVVFVKWRQPMSRQVTEADRSLVAAFLAERHELTEAP